MKLHSPPSNIVAFPLAPAAVPSRAAFPPAPEAAPGHLAVLSFVVDDVTRLHEPPSPYVTVPRHLLEMLHAEMHAQKAAAETWQARAEEAEERAQRAETSITELEAKAARRVDLEKHCRREVRPEDGGQWATLEWPVTARQDLHAAECAWAWLVETGPLAWLFRRRGGSRL